MFSTSCNKIFTFLSRCHLRYRIMIVASISISYQSVMNNLLLQRSLLLEFDLGQFTFRCRAVVYRLPVYFKRLIRPGSCRTRGHALTKSLTHYLRILEWKLEVHRVPIFTVSRIRNELPQALSYVHIVILHGQESSLLFDTLATFVSARCIQRLFMF